MLLSFKICCITFFKIYVMIYLCMLAAGICTKKKWTLKIFSNNCHDQKKQDKLDFVGKDSQDNILLYFRFTSGLEIESLVFCGDVNGY